MHLTILLLLICSLGIAQTVHTPWATTTADTVSDRYDDVFFLDKDTGWAVSLGNGGRILRTYDGGNNWQTLVSGTGLYYRDITFLNSTLGFIGLLFPTPNTYPFMLVTTDGGLNWQPFSPFSPGSTTITGVCGMHKLNNSTISAVGRYYGPAFFFMTNNKGVTWKRKDLSNYARGLIDVFFFTPDTGFASGTLTTFSQSSPIDSCGVILYTTDGGDTWEQVAKTSGKRELCWKLSFPSRNIGYASIDSRTSGAANAPRYFLKTTDGGLTWTEKYLCNDGKFQAQAIGFINDTVGWIGGRNYGTDSNLIYTYQTTDGGETWTPCIDMKSLNRFRFLTDKTGYAAGKQIYKLELPDCDSATLVQVDTTITMGTTLMLPSGTMVTAAGTYFDTITPALHCDSVYKVTVSVVNSIEETKHYSDIRIHPNPAKNQLNIEWNDAGLTFKDAQLISINGQILRISIAQSAQRITLNWSDETPKGVYTLKLKSAEGKEVTRKVVIL